MADDKEKSFTEATEEEAAVKDAKEATYKTATVILSAALLLVLAVFLVVRFIERKNSTATIIVTSQTAEQISSTVSGSSQNTVEKININTATADELCTLTGIGSGRAEAIINYRLENGSFASIEEIMNVFGIGESIFAQIKDSICV